MKVSELIYRLASIIETEGDLQLITRGGEMGDPDPVTEANVVNVEKRGEPPFVWYSIPWDQDAVTNAKAVEIL